MAASPSRPTAPAAWVPYQRFSDLLFVSMAGHWAFAILFGVVAGQPRIGACLAAGGMMMAGLFPLLRSKLAAPRVRAIAHAAMLGNFLLVMLALIWMGQGPEASVWWLVWWPVVAVHVMGLRDGLAWVPVTLLAAGAMWWHSIHPVFHPLMDAKDMPVMVLQLGFLLIGCGIGIVVRHAYEGYQREITRQKATIGAQQHELSARAAHLEDMLQAVQHANLERTRLFAQLSHEVRTPLNGVLGFAQLLGQTPLSETQARHLAQINQCGGTLLHMVNEVLDFSRTQARSTRVEQQPFDLQSVAQEAVDMVSPMAWGKGVGLHIDCEGAPGGQLLGDPLRIKQVMLNLLSNAVKFTSAGEVTLRCMLGPAQSAGALPCLRAEVIDSGIGVPASALPHLFEPFCEASDHTIAHYGGTGLGLAICKRLVDAMGGRIGVSSEVGRGSLFWFEVPVSIRPANPTAATGSGVAAPAHPG